MKYFVFLLILVQFGFAVQLSPMAHKIRSEKSRNVVFNVINTQDRLAASEFEVYRITGHTADGVEVREETDNVVVYPPQFIIKKQTVKKVRVSYRSKKIPLQQEVYRVVAKELPIKVEEEQTKEGVKAGVKFIFSYEGLLFVGGDQKPVKMEVGNVENSSKEAIVSVKNLGNMSEYVGPKAYEMKVYTDKGTVVLDKSYLRDFAGLRILPNETFDFRIQKIKKLKGLKVNKVTVIKRKGNN